MAVAKSIYDRTVVASGGARPRRHPKNGIPQHIFKSAPPAIDYCDSDSLVDDRVYRYVYYKIHTARRCNVEMFTSGHINCYRRTKADNTPLNGYAVPRTARRCDSARG